MMAALSVFQQIGTVADSEFLALEVLPILWSFSLGPLLNLKQFGDFMSLIKNLSSRIEREQSKKLQELSSGGDTGGFQNGGSASLHASINSINSDMDSTRNNFERLVLGRNSSASNNQDSDPWGSLGSEAPTAQASTQKAAFSWASNTVGSTAHSNTPPRQSTLSARSITPDYNLNSFPSLEPASKQKSPTVPAFPSLQPSPSASWGAPSTPNNIASLQRGTMADQSLGTLGSMRPAGGMMSGQSPQPASNYSAFSIPPPPGSQNSMGSFSGTSGLGNAARQSSFGGSMLQSPVSNNATQPPGGAKQGLDKYESLL